MKEKIKAFFSWLFIILCLPMVITVMMQGKNIIGEIGKKNSIKEEEQLQEEIIYRLGDHIGPGTELEAIKVQAVIERTNALLEKEKGKEYVPKRTKKDWEQMYPTFKKAVEDTSGQVLTYKEHIVEIPYFKVSCGATRDGLEATSHGEWEYLKSVLSKEDYSSKDYLMVIVYTKEEFLKKLEMEKKEDEIPILGEITEETSGYVKRIKIYDKEWTGEDLRKRLHLNSACFSIKEIDGKIRIVTKGVGHGFGLSQYGGNEQAKNGESYKKILKHYFPALEIKNNN